MIELLKISKVMLREDYKFLEDFRGKGNLQYCQRNNEKLEDCANNN